MPRGPAILRAPAIAPAERRTRVAADVADETTTDALPATDRLDAHAAGHAAAYAQGHAQGHAQGLAQGLAQSHAEGWAAGLAEGRAAARPQIEAERRAAIERLDAEAAARAQQQASEWAAQTEAAREARQAASRNFAQRLDALDAAWRARLAALEVDAVEVAWQALCRLLGEHVAPAAIMRGLVRQALQAAMDAPPRRVRVHPADHAAWQEAGASTPDDAARVVWVADPAVPRLGCEIDTARGGLAARLDAQLATLRDRWLQVLTDPEASA